MLWIAKQTQQSTNTFPRSTVIHPAAHEVNPPDGAPSANSLGLLQEGKAAFAGGPARGNHSLAAGAWFGPLLTRLYQRSTAVGLIFARSTCRHNNFVLPLGSALRMNAPARIRCLAAHRASRHHGTGWFGLGVIHEFDNPHARDESSGKSKTVCYRPTHEGFTFSAWGPLGPCPSVNVTFCPSKRCSNFPSATLEEWKNMSLA